MRYDPPLMHRPVYIIFKKTKHDCISIPIIAKLLNFIIFFLILALLMSNSYLTDVIFYTDVLQASQFSNIL